MLVAFFYIWLVHLLKGNEEVIILLEIVNVWFKKMSILPPQKGLEIPVGGGGGGSPKAKKLSRNV